MFYYISLTFSLRKLTMGTIDGTVLYTNVCTESEAYYIMLPQSFPQQKQCFIFIEKRYQGQYIIINLWNII